MSLKVTLLTECYCVLLLVLIGHDFGSQGPFGFHPVCVMHLIDWVFATAFADAFTAGKGCQSCCCASSLYPVGRVDRFDINCPCCLVGHRKYGSGFWREYVQPIFLCLNVIGKGQSPVIALLHRFVPSCLHSPGEQLLDTHSVLSCEEVCVVPPHFVGGPVECDLRTVRVFVVVAPSAEFGEHGEHGVQFWDVVIAGYVEEVPSYQSFFCAWDTENGFDLHAAISEFSVDVISKEGDGLVPVSYARLFLTQLESEGS